MRIISYVLLIAVVVMMSACRGSLQQNASSELFVYNNTTGALIANAGTRGAITMNVGDTRQLRVMRRVTDEAEGTTTTNVTTDADYNTSNPGVVTVGNNDTSFAGLITATGLGTAVIDVVVHDPEDPTTDDTASIDINVVP
jgi:hypothetical protein